MLHTMIDDLRGRQSQKSLIEERVEELERRVAEQYKNYQVSSYIFFLWTRFDP